MIEVGGRVVILLLLWLLFCLLFLLDYFTALTFIPDLLVYSPVLTKEDVRLEDNVLNSICLSMRDIENVKCATGPGVQLSPEWELLCS